MNGKPEDEQLFNILRSGWEASKVAAENEGLGEQTDQCVIARIADSGSNRVGSLSAMDGAEHLALMVEATQRFGASIGVSLQVVYGVKPKGQG